MLWEACQWLFLLFAFSLVEQFLQWRIASKLVSCPREANCFRLCKDTKACQHTFPQLMFPLLMLIICVGRWWYWQLAVLWMFHKGWLPGSQCPLQEMLEIQQRSAFCSQGSLKLDAEPYLTWNYLVYLHKSLHSMMCGVFTAATPTFWWYPKRLCSFRYAAVHWNWNNWSNWEFHQWDETTVVMVRLLWILPCYCFHVLPIPLEYPWCWDWFAMPTIKYCP